MNLGKTHILSTVILLLALTLASNANAIIVTGDLSYDNTTDLITNTNTGKQYLGWDLLASTTYGDLLPLLEIGATYEGFHIASQTEALDFFYAAASFDPVAQGFNRNNFNLDSTDFPNQFGGGVNYSSSAFFLSDITNQLGIIYTKSGGLIEFYDNVIGVTSSIGGSCTARGGTCQKSFLLVSNVDAQIPEPSIFPLMGLGLIGLFAINRRKLQA
ncbi:PEP-CTERM sorting domain-containing protein [sulfur-oxidizing endosymbiont of Gigantopelta aegis]|uniref:PEP-CTERM sorting domain-containing protein n=1 Tax=sulfur-oxidizing endosymbiont of Gigantopelta aegis TaxID=2794934 RepID=UPI0018DC2C6A|nr:PEP-CTERM sorting domain-containing protein [sulfur-oxidizing endosymbiont of Gigantopelta aegis]